MVKNIIFPIRKTMPLTKVDENLFQGAEKVQDLIHQAKNFATYCLIGNKPIAKLGDQDWQEGVYDRSLEDFRRKRAILKP